MPASFDVRARIQLTSLEFDAYLRLYEVTDGAAPLALRSIDDDGGVETDALIEMTLEGTTTYEIEVSSYYGDESGRYTLWLDLLNPNAPEPAQPGNRTEDLTLLICKATSDPRPPLGFQDPLHPSHFIRVVERTQDQRRYVLYDPASRQHDLFQMDLETSTEDPRNPGENSETSTEDSENRSEEPTLEASDWGFKAEIDQRSTVVIEFDRLWLVNELGNADLDISISAATSESERTDDVAVLGYRTIGEEATNASAKVASAANIIAQLCDLNEQINDNQINLIFNRLFNVVNDRNVVDLARELMRSNLLNRWDTIPSLLIDANDDGLRNLAESLQSTPERFRIAALGIIEAGNTFRSFSLPAGANLADSAAFARDAFLELDLARGRVETLLREVDSDIAESARNDRERSVRSEVRPGSKRWLDRRLATLMVPMIRDGEIPIAPQRINAGDVITITVTNEADGDPLGRAMNIQLDVVNFGLPRKPKIKDSFFYITRRGVRDDGQRFLNSPPTDFDENLQTVVKTPNPARGTPAPGASALWTWYPRGDSWWKRTSRFFNPGFGVNVSFLRFGEQVTTTTASGDSDNRTVTVKTEDATDPINISVGVIGHLWDGLLQFTVGRNLSVEEKPTYWGIGLSFVELASKAAGGQ